MTISAGGPQSPDFGARSVGALFPYLPAYWREVVSQSGFKGPTDTAYPTHAPVSARPGSRPASGDPPGADLALLRTQALDAPGADIGILNCVHAVDSIHNPYAAGAFASAVNDWQLTEWLEPEPRLRASLVVPAHFPDLAVQEIEPRGAHPGFVQVFLPAHSAAPYGNCRYFPIYEAACRHGLALGIHFGAAPGNPPTPSGWPSYYMEDYANMAAIFQSHVLSVAQGAGLRQGLYVAETFTVAVAEEYVLVEIE